MTSKEKETISKFLSLVLRHKPDTINIQLDANGWTGVADLILKSQEGGVDLSFEKLAEIVETSEKARFAFNETRDRIRANQGHSVKVDLGYSPAQPPEILFHGTATRFADSIMVSGLEKRERHHVHLSKDWDTAVSVGKRHVNRIFSKSSPVPCIRTAFNFSFRKMASGLPIMFRPNI